MRFDLSDGIAMPVTIWSVQASAKVPVVCLHSLFFSGEMFSEVAAKLAVDRTVFAPTYRGHAGVPTHGKQATVEQLAKDVLEFMDTAALDRAHFVGSSMGAYVAMEILKRAPKRIASIILSCCTGAREANPGRFDKLADFIATGPHVETAQTLAELMFGENTCAAPNDVVLSWIEIFGQTSSEMSQAVRAMFAHPDYGATLRGYSGPALLLAGAQDRAKSPTDMGKIAVNMPQAETYVFDGVGHTPAVEDPIKFAARIHDFTASADKKATPTSPPKFLASNKDKNHVI